MRPNRQLRNDAFKKAVAHAKEFLFGSETASTEVPRGVSDLKQIKTGTRAPVVARGCAAA